MIADGRPETPLLERDHAAVTRPPAGDAALAKTVRPLLMFEGKAEEALTFCVDCEDEPELRRLASALGADGRTSMPIGEDGFSRLFVRVSDRYGVS
jgi:predicted 3-demethylubiquinone-9 3-methyltransferase (glyoxalase superfamily)